MPSTQINKDGCKNNRNFKPMIREEMVPASLAALNAHIEVQVQILRKCVNVIEEQVILEQFWGI